MSLDVGGPVVGDGFVERTESIVVQVAPSYENQKIEEMENFGWSLHGRQEIHERGEAYGRPSYLSDSTYIVKTTVHSYVKLHFVRSLNLPNRDEVRKLEAEYSSLPFPATPSLVAPGCFTAFWLFGIPVSLVMMSEDLSTGLGLLGVYAVFIALGIFWVSGRRKKRKGAQETCIKSLSRANELRLEAQRLLA